MAISKIVYKSSSSATPVTWMDATSATASASDITAPKTAMLADGVMTTGTGSGGSSNITGTFTVPSSGSNYTLEFGTTLTSYLFKIEMDDTSKATLMSQGGSGIRGYCFVGSYPAPPVGNVTPSNYVTVYRINPSTSETSIATSAGYSSWITGSSIKISIGAYSASSIYLYYGLTYKYTICPI